MKKEKNAAIPLFSLVNEPKNLNKFVFGTSDTDKQKKDTLAFALNRYKKSANISGKQLAEIIGTSRSLAYCYLNGTRSITFDMLIIICISLRLHPLRTEHLFELSHYKLRKNDSRYYILKEFLYGCAFMECYTVKACNQKLIENGFHPLVLDLEDKQ